MDYIYTLQHIITITTEFTFEEPIFLLPPDPFLGGRSSLGQSKGMFNIRQDKFCFYVDAPIQKNLNPPQLILRILTLRGRKWFQRKNKGLGGEWGRKQNTLPCTLLFTLWSGHCFGPSKRWSLSPCHERPTPWGAVLYLTVWSTGDSHKEDTSCKRRVCLCSAQGREQASYKQRCRKKGMVVVISVHTNVQI